MSAADSSDSSDNETPDAEDSKLSRPVPTPPPSQQSQLKSQPAQNHHTPPPSTTSNSTLISQSTKTPPSSTNSTQPPLITPLVYQTAQGMVYATPSNGGVIFSLAQGDPNLGHPPQFITIPLSVMTANGQGELDLSKRK